MFIISHSAYMHIRYIFYRQVTNFGLKMELCIFKRKHFVSCFRLCMVKADVLHKVCKAMKHF